MTTMDLVRETLWSQFGAAIQMLEEAIKACPDELWDAPDMKPPFWYIAYHTLFFLDFYLGESVEEYRPPAPFDMNELDPSGKMPERTFTKAELLGYLAIGRAKAQAVFGALDEARIARMRTWWARTLPELTHHVYCMRHVQHHAAQLYLLLRQRTDSAPNWVSLAPQPLEPSRG